MPNTDNKVRAASISHLPSSFTENQEVYFKYRKVSRSKSMDSMISKDTSDLTKYDTKDSLYTNITPISNRAIFNPENFRPPLAFKTNNINNLTTKNTLAQLINEPTLFHLCSKGDVQPLQSLFEITTDKHIDNILFVVASEQGYKDKVDDLITRGADVNFTDQDGINPLYAAAFQGHQDIVTLLINKGANVNDADKSGTTPLWIAAQNGYVNIVNILIANEANVNTADKSGTTPLWIAAQNGHVNIVNILIANEADIDYPDNDGATPLWISAQNGHQAVVDALINKGANTNIADKEGVTPLLIATQYGYEAIVDALINKGADLDSSDKDDVTAIMVALREGYENVAISLLNKGADVNLPDKSGDTPILVALQEDSEIVINALISKWQEDKRKVDNIKKNAPTTQDLTYHATSDVIESNSLENIEDLATNTIEKKIQDKPLQALEQFSNSCVKDKNIVGFTNIRSKKISLFSLTSFIKVFTPILASIGAVICIVALNNIIISSILVALLLCSIVMLSAYIFYLNIHFFST